ncbi:exported protein [Sphingomonas sp. DBB INV C78]|uniref:TorF family putative porin n=1 Tax=Sphingomonas sp. DBB INV C78 TaxID=3349434 RepID=UPI0036D2BEA4
MINRLAAAAAVLLATTPAMAQEAPAEPITVSGSVALVSDYRFRGVSQSDKEMAIQGGITVGHESGLYAGTWGSSLSGWGTFGGGNMELDLFAGYKLPVGGATVDVGLTWYMYPGGADNTDFAEPYVKVSGTAGPVSLLAGIAYAPKQEALGNFSATPQSRGQKEDNLYLWGDASGAIPGTPITLKGHIGYSDGNPGLGPNGTSIAPTGKYWDWLVGADVAVGPVLLGVAYVDTDISKADSAYLLPNFSSTKNGSSIASGRIVFSATAAF